MITVDKDLQSEVIKHYGADKQLTICMEEPAELIQAVSKMARGTGELPHLAEEMADTLIILKQLQQIFGISDELLQMWVDCKQGRTRKALHGLVAQELIERASQGQPAVESCGEYRELVCEAAPPKNGYAISKKGFESAIWKKICARWERSLAELANGG